MQDWKQRNAYRVRLQMSISDIVRQDVSMLKRWVLGFVFFDLAELGCYAESLSGEDMRLVL